MHRYIYMYQCKGIQWKFSVPLLLAILPVPNAPPPHNHFQSFFLLLFHFLNWRIIALQYCIGFWCTTWTSYKYTSISSFVSVLPTPSSFFMHMLTNANISSFIFSPHFFFLHKTQQTLHTVLHFMFFNLAQTLGFPPLWSIDSFASLFLQLYGILSGYSVIDLTLWMDTWCVSKSFATTDSAVLLNLVCASFCTWADLCLQDKFPEVGSLSQRGAVIPNVLARLLAT